MSDIVEDLLAQADADEQAGTLYAHELGRRAAAEIVRLRAENGQLHHQTNKLAQEILLLRALLKRDNQ